MPFFIPLIPALIAGGVAVAAAIGGKKAYDAYKDKDEAEKVNKDAQTLYNNAKAELDKERLSTQKSLEDLSKNRTCITIAHRLSTIRNADEIVVIDATGMHERGTHDELMKLNGTYAKYYKLQFEDLN